MERLDKAHINLGKVNLGSKHEFEVTNMSDYRVDRVKVGCGCTSAILSSTGIRQKIKLTLSITNEFPYSVGKDVKELNQKKIVTIHFSDGHTHDLDINYILTRNG